MMVILNTRSVTFCHVVQFYQRKFYSLNFVKLVSSSSCHCESHQVITEDEFILTLHRILPQKYINKFNKIPILLQHGLWSTSADWVLPGPSKSIGHLLAESGFDVWLGNTRGNHYSKNHKRYSPHKNPKEYWNFSFHEMGCFDLPAMIDYILKYTGRTDLYYIGHSQGTTIFFVMSSMKPEYRSKIKAMFGLAPVAYLRHMRNAYLLNLAAFQQSVLTLLTQAGFYKLLLDEPFLSLCDKFVIKNVDKLSSTFLKLSSYPAPEVKQNLQSILMSHVSCGTSFKLLGHYAQCTFAGKKFRQFDYGPGKNFQLYGQQEAPNYELKNISIPIVLFHSTNDWLTHPKDVKSLIEDLPDSTKEEKIEDQKFYHQDFLWADFKELQLYDKLMNHLNNYESYIPEK